VKSGWAYNRDTFNTASRPVLFENQEPRRPIGFGREDEIVQPRIQVVRGITQADLEDWRRQRERPAK
jgi:hypothetical protein